MPKPNTVSIEERNEYLFALGSFINQFAQIEASLHRMLRRYAGLSNRAGAAVFSGVRVHDAMSFIVRLTEVNDPGLEIKEEIAYIFKQLRLINSLRNDLIHCGSAPIDGKRTLTNKLSAHIDERIREMQITPQTLRDATSDLTKINAHIFCRLCPTIPPGITHYDPILRAVWRYKPPPQAQRRRKTRDTNPKRKPPPPSSRK